MLLADDCRVIFVTGKGGVGKTSISSALALRRMNLGQRVLLVSTDPAHNLGHLWDTRLTDEPTVIAAGAGSISAIEIDPATTVTAHFAAVRRQMLRTLPENLHAAAEAHLESARHAPGSHESAMLEKVADAVELARREYDVVIFDTAPTGHTLRLLAMPATLSTWTEQLLRSRDRAENYSDVLSSMVGGRRERTEPRDRDAELRRVLTRRQQKMSGLRDALRTDAGFIVVTVAEPMPVSETLELVDELGDLSLPVDTILVNRRSPTDAGEFLAQRHRLENIQIDRLRGKARDVPVVEVGMAAEPPQGRDGVAWLAAGLDEGVRR